jgi:hypothetical protein
MGSLYIPSPRTGLQFPLNVNQRAFPYNEFDNALLDEYCVWATINAGGGIKQICPGLRYKDPPWIKMPLQGKRFSEIKSIPLPNPTGVDTLVGSFMVPAGFDGVGVAVIFNYTGQGFQEGSGDITWRLQLNQHFVKDYGNVQTQLGSLQTPYNQNSGQILLLANQEVQFWVNISTASLGNLNGGRIIASLWGWYYPR